MYERNFTLGRLFFVTAVAVSAYLIGRSSPIEELWGKARQIGDRAIHEVRGIAGDEIKLAARQEGAVEQRIGELRDGDTAVRRYAAWALGELESRRAVDPLIESLRDRDADVRLVSAWALGEIKDQEAIDPLIELTKDDDALVREMAVLSLGEIENASAVGPIVDAVERHPELREPAIWALGEIGGRRADSAREELFGELERRGWENDEVWAGRLGTREAGSIGNDVSALSEALGDDDKNMRASAAEWLGRADDERAVEALLDALRDVDPSVRAMAIWALDETNPSRQHESHSHSDHDCDNDHDRDEHDDYYRI